LSSLGVGSARRTIFKNNEALWRRPLLQGYAEEHKKKFSSEIDKQGYPDMGNGLFSQQLSYSDWVDFNNAQRVHYKVIEESGPFLACALATGLIYPRTVASMVALNIVGRVLWAGAYTSKGSAKRYSNPLVLLYPLTNFGLLLTTVVAGLNASTGQPAAGFFAGVAALRKIVGL
jgi:hypothetical protein